MNNKRIRDWIVLIQKKKNNNEFGNMWLVKSIEHLHHQKSFSVCICIKWLILALKHGKRL